MSYYRQQLEDWLKELDVKSDTVLDIGGAQNPVKGRTKSWDVKKYYILDLYTEYHINLDEQLTNVNLLKFGEEADVIFCLEVFEYLISPLLALKNIEEFLKSDGRAYITFAFTYPHHNELEMDSLRYTEPGIKRLAEAIGLRITNTWYRRDKSGLLKSFYAMDGMRMAKEYPNHDVTGFIVELTKE